MVSCGLYESDIVYFGGHIVYSGYITFHGFHYRKERAKLYLDALCIDVSMKRFKDGSALIDGFLDDDGREIAMRNVMDYLPATHFFKEIYSHIEQDAAFMEFLMFRKIKQYVTFFFQFISGLIFIYALYCALFFGLSPRTIILLGTSIATICTLSCLYKYFRHSSLSDYKEKRDKICRN